MNTISKDVIVTQEINKSSFITYLKQVSNVDDAKSYIAYVKKLHPDATHHVSVYIVGKTGEYGHANDDGEPQGTAALPIMDVFKKNNVTNFCCIVVRYFGGIKLGAGGLVRAYSSSASLGLKEAGICEIITYSYIKLIFDYTFMGIIESKLKNIQIVEKSFNTKVELIIKLKEQDISSLTNILISVTNNQIIIENVTL